MAKIKIKNKYSSLVTSDVRYHLVTGGRGSGKSYSVNTLLCLLMLEDDRTILFLRKTLTSAHLSIIPEFLDKIKTMGLESLFHVTKTEIFNKTNGSSIYFRGVQSSSGENTANLKSIANVSVLVIDEAEELTDETTFDRIDLSVRKKGVDNKIIIVMNPATKEHFIYQRFIESAGINEGFNGQKGNVNYIHTTYLDNIENLDESFVEAAELMKVRNPEKYKTIMLGGWLPKAEGVIFNNWEVGEFVETDNTLFGADFGFSVDPTTLIRVAIDKSRQVIYLKEECYTPGMTTDDIGDLMTTVCGKSLIVADSAEPRLIDELSKKGLNIIPCVKGAGSVREGIALLLNYSIIIDSGSSNIIKEANNYAWSNKKSETPIDKWNHAWDAIRYAATHALTNKKREVSFGW